MEKQFRRSMYLKMMVCWLFGVSATGCGKRADAEKEPAKSVEALSSPDEKEASKSAITESNVCASAIGLICAEFGDDSGVCGLMRSSAKTMTKSRCNELLADPERTLGEMRGLEESRMPLSEEKRARIETGDAPGWGPEDAPVTVTTFSNLDCDPCVQMGLTVPRLPVWYPGKVRVVHRIHPAENPFSAQAARAVYAAAAQGKFAAYYECLFNNQHDMGREAVERCVGEVGLSAKPFLKEMESEEAFEAVRRDQHLGVEMRVGRPPYFFVNGARVAPGDGERALRKAVEEAIRKQDGV